MNPYIADLPTNLPPADAEAILEKPLGYTKKAQQRNLTASLLPVWDPP